MAYGLLRTCLGVCVLLLSRGTGFAADQQHQFQLSADDLRLLGQVQLLEQQFEKDGLVYADAELESYVNRVGQALLPTDAPPNFVTWRFRVLRDPTENAFALPNGSIYVHSGLLALLHNEDELASVLAHEIVHVMNRHSYRAYRDYRKKAATANILGAIGGFIPARSVTGITVWAVMNTVVPSILLATINGYSRELETEADLQGLATLRRAGYDPFAMTGTFRALQTEDDVELAVYFYRDHPKLAERIVNVERALKMEPNPTRDSENFERRAADYATVTGSVSRHDITLDIAARRLRTAVIRAERLAARWLDSSELAVLVGDAYRSLGPRTLRPTSSELTETGRKEALKARLRLTPEEQDRQLLATLAGRAAWDENVVKSEAAYRRALDLDAQNPQAYRGLGLLTEADGRSVEAITHYRRYLDLLPQAPDAARIRSRMARLEKPSTF